MTTSMGKDIRRHLDAYLRDETLLQEFTDWFWPATWSIGPQDDPLIIQLAGDIQLRLSEFDAGHWTESELREQLRTILNATIVEHAIG